MNPTFEINTNPTKENLNKIKTWLIDENRKSKQGFYCNWNVIEKSFEKKRINNFSK